MSKLLVQDSDFRAMDSLERRVRLIEERNAQMGGTGGGGSLGVGTIMDAHVNSNAGIQLTKLAQDPRARSTHTGTQTAATISDFSTAVTATRLDQFAAPTAGVNLNSQKITNLGAPTVGTDATTKTYVDAGDTAAKDRANHTGTQLAATISNFDAQVRTSRLDQMAAPTAAVAFNSQKITGLADPTASQDASTKAYTDARAGSTVLLDNVPIGTIVPFGGSTAPAADWAICDGSPLDKTTYAALYAVLKGGAGTSPYGESGSNFNLPDLRGRVAVGAGTGTASDATAKTIGNASGTENHTLNTNQIPAHTHTVSDPGHAHSNTNGAFLNVSASVSTFLNTTNNAAYAVYHAPSTATAFTSISIPASGGGGLSHPNMQPYLVTQYIIKISARAPAGLMAATEAAPVGTVVPYAGATAPNVDWLLCQGQAVSRTTYAALFAIIGTTYGSGDGSTTFTLPDLRGRVPVGSGTGSGLTNRVMGTVGGEENHTLTVGEMPSHNHGGGDHAHGLSPSSTVLATGSAQHWAFATAAAGPDITVASIAASGAIINLQGGGAAHNTMPPFVVTNYIIRATSVTPTKYSLLGDLSPIGSVTAFAGGSLPSDWLLCDGSSLLRTDYPELFSVIGTTWGSVDATHFSLPDLRGRTLIGAGTGLGSSATTGGTGLPSGTALTARTLGQWGGEENHTTTISEMPSHQHGGGDHTHQIATYNMVGAGAWAGGVQGVSGQNQFTGVYAGTVGSGVIIAPQGGGAGHNTMQPWAVLNYIIKVKQTVATTTTGNSSKSKISFTGDGATKTFTLRHTLSLAANDPYIGMIWEADGNGNPVRQATADIEYVDFQNVNVVFGNPPANGTRYILTVLG